MEAPGTAPPKRRPGWPGVLAPITWLPARRWLRRDGALVDRVAQRVPALEKRGLRHKGESYG